MWAQCFTPESTTDPKPSELRARILSERTCNSPLPPLDNIGCPSNSPHRLTTAPQLLNQTRYSTTAKNHSSAQHPGADLSRQDHEFYTTNPQCQPQRNTTSPFNPSARTLHTPTTKFTLPTKDVSTTDYPQLRLRLQPRL